MSSPVRLFVLVPLLAITAFVACRGSSLDDGPIPEPVPGQTQFESDDPSPSVSGAGGGDDAGGSVDGGTVAVDTGSASDGGVTVDPSSDDALRAIEEADIVKVDGARLYALSQTGGLSIIDVGTRDTLKFLGRWRAQGRPFEMYVRDGVVLAMVNGFQDWSSGYSVKQTARVIALDVKDPKKITTVGDFAVPGEVSDSRIVGDVMYVVTQQDGTCWKCESKPATVVMSLGVKNPLAIAKVDEIAFKSSPGAFSWQKRSVTATDTRFWIGGPDWDWTEGTKPRSIVQALDVSDPKGKLTLGASVKLDGMITSRWQMDERAGVLRVVSQSAGWTGLEPSVQTFTVASSSDVKPLGQMTLKLPKPETLTSVRFDGARAYAITTERTDPLFTIDLADPAKPMQMGELSMPGSIVYMEPRGNRLLGLGFDASDPEGGMNVSLFDVSDLKSPKMLKRVSFGKGWASAPEDQDRIHKAFRVIDDEKLIMVPFAANDWREKSGPCHAATSGIQLVDWKDDTLALRAVAKVWGSPRRAFIHDQRLFAVSDAQVATYDITNRDTPIAKATLPLSSPSHKSVVLGDNLVQLSDDTWTQHAQLTVVPRASIDQAIPIATLDLAPMLDDSCGYYGWSSWWYAQLHLNGTYAYVVVPAAQYSSLGSETSGTIVGVVDLADPKKPVLVSRTTLPSIGDPYRSYFGPYGVVLATGAEAVRAGATVAVMRNGYAYSAEKGYSLAATEVYSIDFSDPKRPKANPPLTLAPAGLYTGLVVADGAIFTSHYESTSAGKVRFFVDELALGATPHVIRSVNTPGSLLAFDPSSGHALTVDYRKTLHASATYETCAVTRPAGDIMQFDWASSTCVTVHRTVRQVKIVGSTATMEGSLELPRSTIGAVVADGRRVILRSGYPFTGAYYGPEETSENAGVISGIREGAAKLSPAIALGVPAGYDANILRMSEERAIVQVGNRMLALDLATAHVLREASLGGYYASDVTLADDAAYVSLGNDGVTAISLR